MSKKEWKSGYPRKRGIYKCRIDGKEEQPLMHKCCEITDRHRWMTLDGQDIVGHAIEWKEGTLGAADL